MAKSKAKTPAKKKLDPLETFAALRNEVADMETNLGKFIVDGVAAACSRARKNAQAIKKLAQQIRLDVQEMRNAKK